VANLDMQTVIVTGATHGIGSRIAERCSQGGASVILVARNSEELKSKCDQLNQNSNLNHRYYQLDISDLKAVKKFASWLIIKNINVTGLVNCAGVYGPIGKTIDIDMEKFTEAIQINFLGTVYMCNAVIPLMKSNAINKVVNISGGGAASPFPFYSAYATSKIALVRFTENVSLELDVSKFNINCVAPGFVVTRLHQDTLAAGPDKSGSAFYKQTLKQIESEGTSPDVAANLTAYLLSKDSDGINGKFISAPWDNWENRKVQEKLKRDADFCTLRRIDDKYFFKFENRSSS
jgi:NAD(P)-dependent dehydrogenase (short-subunit alcohol dehydrogenase family)